MIMKENSTMMKYYLRGFTWIVTPKITYGDSRYLYQHLAAFDPTSHNLVKSLRPSSDAVLFVCRT